MGLSLDLGVFLPGCGLGVLLGAPHGSWSVNTRKKIVLAFVGSGYFLSESEDEGVQMVKTYNELQRVMCGGKNQKKFLPALVIRT